MLTVAIAQIAPVWLDRDATLAKVVAWIDRAAAADCGLVAFGEALVPGYPFWLEWTGGARFDDTAQKDLFAHYSDQAVGIERGDLTAVCAAAARGKVAVIIGVIERAADRSGTACIAPPSTSRPTDGSRRSTASSSRPMRSAWSGPRATGTASSFTRSATLPSARSTASRTGCRSPALHPGAG